MKDTQRHKNKGIAKTANIDSLHVGDMVLTRSELDPTRRFRNGPSPTIFVHHVDSLRILQIATPDGNTETIQTTDVHPFYLSGTGWVDAGNLQAGATLTMPASVTFFL